MIKQIINRIYSDFFMPSRLKEYELLLLAALNERYYICSIETFWNMYRSNKFDKQKKYVILRHDIDTDVSTAQEMFKIEKKLGVTASYYFRLSTLDIQFMQDIQKYGSEASYHYEEIASYAKKHCVTDPQIIYSNIDTIREMFALNLYKLRNTTGLPMNIVASHGDFANRILCIPNHELLKDDDFRKKNNIYLEVYDTEIMEVVTSRHSDTMFPTFWKPNSPVEAINSGSAIIYILTHPRHWRVHIIENLEDDVKRLIEGFRFNKNRC